MKSKLIARPYRARGASSNYWELPIPPSIVKKYQIDESTNFLQLLRITFLSCPKLPEMYKFKASISYLFGNKEHRPGSKI